jgi:3-oxoacyl-[acyl-carrier protein] reductase
MVANLEGKRVLVTGASQGIGREIALRLSIEGAWVAVNYLSNRHYAEQIAETITQQGGKSLLVQADVSKPDQVERMIGTIVEEWQGVDILINNAGITRDNLLIRMTEEDWDNVLDTNLKGAFLCAKAVVRHMIKSRWGRILNMSSIVALTGNAGQTNYTAAKAGLIGFTRSLSLEVASRNITVNAIAPGFIETGMVETLGERIKTALLERIPVGRLGTPKDVAALAVFLLSEEAAYITGQTISVDGGLSL